MVYDEKYRCDTAVFNFDGYTLVAYISEATIHEALTDKSRRYSLGSARPGLIT